MNRKFFYRLLVVFCVLSTKSVGAAVPWEKLDDPPVASPKYAVNQDDIPLSSLTGPVRWIGPIGVGLAGLLAATASVIDTERKQHVMVTAAVLGGTSTFFTFLCLVARKIEENAKKAIAKLSARYADEEAKFREMLAVAQDRPPEVVALAIVEEKDFGIHLSSVDDRAQTQEEAHFADPRRYSIGTYGSGGTSVSKKDIKLGDDLLAFVTIIDRPSDLHTAHRGIFFEGMRVFHKKEDRKSTNLGFMGEKVVVEISDLANLTRPIMGGAIDHGSRFPVLSRTAIRECDKFLKKTLDGLHETEQVCVKRLMASVFQHIINKRDLNAVVYVYPRDEDEVGDKFSTFLFANSDLGPLVAITCFYGSKEYGYPSDSYFLE